MFLLGHGALVLAILLAPWPENYSVFWLILLVAVIFECIRSQRRIARNRGELQLLAPQVWHWQLREWRLARRPWVSDLGALLILQSTHGAPCRRRLWLAADSMSREEWGSCAARCSMRATIAHSGAPRRRGRYSRSAVSSMICWHQRWSRASLRSN